jgi:hypothetical protein
MSFRGTLVILEDGQGHMIVSYQCYLTVAVFVKILHILRMHFWM